MSDDIYRRLMNAVLDDNIVEQHDIIKNEIEAEHKRRLDQLEIITEKALYFSEALDSPDKDEREHAVDVLSRVNDSKDNVIEVEAHKKPVKPVVTVSTVHRGLI